MNESLHRALLRAHLSEEDVAARLQVDPKTVRRWLEGRIPYPRHRWLLASELGLDEADLWPQIGASRSWPQEVQAVYPRREDVPRETWLRLFSRAQERIDILAAGGVCPAADPEALAVLADRAMAGVKERICLRDPDLLEGGARESLGMSPRGIRDALAGFGSVRECGDVEVRAHGKQLNNSIYRSDGESLIFPSIYGIPDMRVPVLHLRRTRGDDLFDSYLNSFQDVWTRAYLL